METSYFSNIMYPRSLEWKFNIGAILGNFFFLARATGCSRSLLLIKLEDFLINTWLIKQYSLIPNKVNIGLKINYILKGETSQRQTSI